MRILCTGISHKTAPVALRERLALDEALAARDLAARWEAAEFVVLSTCNRTEIYVARPVHGHPREEELRRWLCDRGGAGAEAALYTFADGEAVGHLFAVAAGLDSLVPGEAQIAAQLKGAYAAAAEAGAARGRLADLMQRALHVGKRVRTETAIGEGKVSVASVAVDSLAKRLGRLAGRCVLNVGAGKMNELMLRRLAGLGAGRIVVANRSPERADELAAKCGAETAPFDQLEALLSKADVVVTSTAAEAPIITADMLARALAGRAERPMLIIDIAVPRDVEAAAGALEGVRLYNIDDLEAVVRATLRTREQERSAAEEIVEEEVAAFLKELNVRDVAPTIDALYGFMRGIAEEELADGLNKLSTHEDAEADAEVIRRVLRRAIGRILHPAARHLRQAAGADAARADVAALRRLFDLEEE